MPENPTAGEIVEEIIEKMTKKLSSEKKSFASGALNEWTPKLKIAVAAALKQQHDWNKEKKNVLGVAKDMAKIGAILSASSATVSKARVHAAFRAVKEHGQCPGRAGSGRWCDFDI